MPNNRDLRLEKYEISQHRYRELLNFCLQYPEWIQERKCCYSDVASRSDGMPRGNLPGDPVAQRAAKAERLSEKITLVEQTAIEADGDLYSYILKAVTERSTWWDLQPPCGVNQFNALRHKFFYLLHLKKG